MNKILKDIINRYDLLQDKKVFYRPGWDCHGLPIELKALQTLSQEAKKDVATVLSPTEIRTIAKSHALEAIEDQMASFRKFGIMADWANKYRTLDTDYEVRQLNVFKEMMHRGFISRKNKPVYWGTETRTALAEAELEYNEKHKSTSASVKFPIVKLGEELKAKIGDKIEGPLNALIWTTTPWTLVSNKAIAVNAEMEYVVVFHETHGHFIVAESRRASLGEEFNKVEGVSFTGADLLTSTFKTELTDSTEERPFLAAAYVTSTVGTGLVHTAPGHGFDDYLLCRKHSIDTYSPVDDRGNYTADLPASLKHLEGLYVLNQGQKEVIKILEDKGAIISINRNFRHKYPYDWRSKKPIIIRSTPQWFADIDSIKNDAVKSLDDVVFYPTTGKNRLEAFTQSRSEWCISRQRVWGVPIPAIYNKNTMEPLTDIASMDYVISQIETLGADAWFEDEEDVQRWLPLTPVFEGKGKEYIKGKDTMDVWFDSGTSWTMLDPNREYLADYYLEGTDQHRGWFQSSLLTKIATSEKGNVKAPFKHVITHGFTLDEKGQKMSKSLGNTIAPEKIMGGQKGQWPPLGVDGLRLWVASSDYTKDVSVGPKVLKNVAESLKKLRITLRFLLGSLHDYTGELGFNQQRLHPIDLIALHQLKQMTDQVKEQYDSFSFNRAIQTINHFTSTNLSAFYFDIVKDRLYASPQNSTERRAVQFVLSEILRVYLSILSPVLPLLTQEAYDYLPKSISKGLDSPFKAGWVNLPEEYINPVFTEEIPRVEKVISVVKQAMESGRVAK